MPELPEKDSRLLDEELARFADQVLSAEHGGPPEPASPDSELRRLEQTVLRLKSAFGPPETPPQSAAERIRLNLMHEWQKHSNTRLNSKPEAGAGRSSWQSWLQRYFGWDTPNARRRTLTLAFSSLAVIMLIAALVTFPTTPEGQPAAAGNIPVLVVFMLFAAAALAAFFSSRRH